MKKAKVKRDNMSEKIEFETFRGMGAYEIDLLKQESPSCFNGVVRIRKYRVTIEAVEESNDAVKDRLIMLWKGNTNHHERDVLVMTGKELGIDLHALEQGETA